MIADLAVAPYPLSLVKPPLRRLDEDLPALGEYQVKLLSAAPCSESPIHRNEPSGATRAWNPNSGRMSGSGRKAA